MCKRRHHREAEDGRNGVGRSQQLRVLVEHYENPRHRRFHDRADVAVAGGQEHGGSVVVYLKGNGHGGIQDVSFTAEGDAISIAATSVLMELVHDGGLTMDEVLALDHEGFVEGLGRALIGDRTRQAILGLSTLKHAVRTYQRDISESGRDPDPSGSGELSRRLVYSRRPGGGDSMHAITVLEEDHVRIETLLEALANATDPQASAAFFGRLEKELVVHTLAEESIFLPHVEDAIEDVKRTTNTVSGDSVEDLDEASELLATSYGAHQRVRDLLELMNGLEATDDGWKRKERELRLVVRSQIGREEELFPKARAVLEEEDFERIGDLLEHCKWQVRGLTQAKLASSASFRPSPFRQTAPLFDRVAGTE